MKKLVKPIGILLICMLALAGTAPAAQAEPTEHQAPQRQTTRGIVVVPRGQRLNATESASYAQLARESTVLVSHEAAGEGTDPMVVALAVIGGLALLGAALYAADGGSE